MRKALIDQMMLWIILFVAFVTMFYVILNYYTFIRAKDKSDALVNYGVRMKALGKSDSVIVTGLNNIRGSYFDTISEDDISCTQDDSSSDYQVVFISNISISNMFLNENEKITSQSASFNESGSSHVECNLTLRPQ